jgi:hypothetical protein
MLRRGLLHKPPPPALRKIQVFRVCRLCEWAKPEVGKVALKNNIDIAERIIYFKK